MRPMFDFHIHTFMSDGDLISAESVRISEMRGYEILGLADHSDFGNIAIQMSHALAAADAENQDVSSIKLLAGTEITYVRPSQIERMTARARELGAKFVIMHGETLIEPIAPGTNRAAIDAGVDILAHPGLISEEEVELAASKGVMLEISGKCGHCIANGHVASLARKYGAQLIFGSDAHTASEIPTRDFAEKICLAAGLQQWEVDGMFRHAEKFGRDLLREDGVDS